VQLTGVALALLEVPAELEAEFNDWYDLDHQPEHVSLPDVLYGRRYKAPARAAGSAALIASDLTSGHPNYATLYLMGGPADFTGEAAQAGHRTKDRELRRQGRFWSAGRVVYTTYWRFQAASTRPSLRISAEAAPFIAHRGLIAAVGRPGPSAGLDDACRWWDEVEIPDLFDVPGIEAVVRFETATGDTAAPMLHLVYLSRPASALLPAIEAMRERQGLLGRFPPHAQAYEPLVFLPYDWIVPLDHAPGA
jgi:hypothetical protein